MVQRNPVNKNTKGTFQSVCIIGVSVLCGLSDIKSRKSVLLMKRLRQTFLGQENV